MAPVELTVLIEFLALLVILAARDHVLDVFEFGVDRRGPDHGANGRHLACVEFDWTRNVGVAVEFVKHLGILQSKARLRLDEGADVAFVRRKSYSPRDGLFGILGGL